MSAQPTDAWWTRSQPEHVGDVVVDGEVPAEVASGPGPTVLLSRRRLRQIRGLRGSRELPARRRPQRTLLATTAALLAAGSAGGGAYLALRPEPATGPQTAARAVVVDRASVAATASSTQTPDGDITYAAANTLDGDLSTAWNSNGKRDGNGADLALTYTFAQPIDLRDLTVHNGYQKLRVRPGKAALDLYPVNQRVRRLRVVTDAGRWMWELADTRTPQTFAGAAGRTGSVRLEILSVYPSTAYPDVALSEVAFTSALEPLEP